MSDPGDVRVCAFEVAVGRIYQHGECGFGLEAASLPEREDSFHPTVSFFAGGPKTAVAPHHLGDQPVACMLGGPGRRTLFVLRSRIVFDPEKSRALKCGRIETVRVDVPGAGLLWIAKHMGAQEGAALSAGVSCEKNETVPRSTDAMNSRVSVSSITRRIISIEVRPRRDLGICDGQ